jgi:tetratricopeptide (TPR) repeat protein
MLAEDMGTQATAAGVDREQARAHADGCSLCASRVRDHRSAQSRIRSLVSPVASVHTTDVEREVRRTKDCPPEQMWTSIVAGLTSAAESEPLLRHASLCDYCGPWLRAATEDLDPEISAEESEAVRRLPSAGVGWQRDLARKMAQVSGAPSKDESRDSAHPSWSFTDWKVWGVPLGAAAIVAVGAAILIDWNSPSLSSTNQLIAQAYSEERPIELRFPGAAYAPVRQERGAGSPDRSRMDEPSALLQAETQIARARARHPHDPGWMQAQARVDLFEGHADQAIELLQQSEAARPEDDSVSIDLATAFYERAGTQLDSAARAADYERALQTLNLVLGKNPNALVALFNRALIYQQRKKYSEAIADWQRYLQLESSGRWAEDARRALGAAQQEGNV